MEWKPIIMKPEQLELASRLHGREYPYPMMAEDIQFAKEHGLVVVTGLSDDIVSYEGAFNDEGYGPIEYITAKGRIEEPDCDCDAARREHKRLCESAAHFEVKQGGEVGNAYGAELEVYWHYVAHGFAYEPFFVMEDGEVNCIGMVIDIADLPGNIAGN